MKKVTIQHFNGEAFKVLCLGAHCDDIEIGCGGTLLKLAQDYKNLDVTWVVFCSTPERARETAASADQFLGGIKKTKIVIKNFRDGFLPYQASDVKELFEQLKLQISPDIILTHYRDDRHQDHRVVSDLTWNTFRDHLILEYEVPKYDGDFGTPNFFVRLDEGTCLRKAEILAKHYVSQRGRHWFTEDVFLATARLRGMESSSSAKYAEAFYCRKIAL